MPKLSLTLSLEFRGRRPVVSVEPAIELDHDDEDFDHDEGAESDPDYWAEAAEPATSSSGAIQDLDALLEQVRDSREGVETSTGGWASGPGYDTSPAGLVKLTDAQKLERLDDVWELERDGELIAMAPVAEEPRACPCYPALDGGQGPEAQRADEEAVAEFGRCDSTCPTLEP